MDFDYRSFCDFVPEDLNDLWGADYNDTLKTVNEFELSCLVDASHHSGSNVVLHDRLMTEASLGLLQHKQPSLPIKDEHSYSLSVKSTDEDTSDIEKECFPAISMTEADGSRTSSQLATMDVDCMSTSDTVSCYDDSELSNDFNFDDYPEVETCINEKPVSPCSCSNPENLKILSVNKTSTNCLKNCISSENLETEQKSTNYTDVITKISENTWPVECHVNPSTNERVICFPPTPPSSFGSDNESGCSSPPLTPLYETLPQFCGPIRKQFTKHSTRTPISTPLISSQPKGAIGDLHLTEEEKRTLVSEGYSVPSRLPLTKAEEKSLKKIRRKIKNKISAQESRRKKKEYMDTLEGKVELLEQENRENKRKLGLLQSKNASLLQELHRLQAMVQQRTKVCKT